MGPWKSNRYRRPDLIRITPPECPMLYKGSELLTVMRQRRTLPFLKRRYL